MVRFRAVLLGAAVAAAIAVTGQAGEYERAIVVAPETVLGVGASGDFYRVENPVVSDGILNNFTVFTKYGRYRFQGRPLLDTRLNELAALEELSKTSQGGAYIRGLGNTARQPFEFAARAVTRPAETVTSTLSGIGEAFDRLASSVTNIGETPEGPLATITGISDTKREIAARFGVDPYSDFPPLARRLTELARALSAGEITVKASMIALPGLIGTAGLMVSGTRVADSVRRLIYTKTAAQLRDHIKEALDQIGVRDKVQAAFLESTYLTPTDRALIVDALDEMTGVGERALLIADAAGVKSRGMAMFVRRRALLLAAHHREREPFSAFISVSGQSLNVTRGGRVVLLAPIEHLAWTQQSATYYQAATTQLVGEGRMIDAEIRITGQATPKARAALGALGWTVSEAAGA